MGELAEEWQNPDGTVDPSGPAAVQYTYQDGASGSLAAYLRLTDVTYPSGTYPSGQEIEYNYGDDLTSQAAVDAIMSRLSSISDSGSGGTDAVYTYLGLDTHRRREL